MVVPRTKTHHRDDDSTVVVSDELAEYYMKGGLSVEMSVRVAVRDLLLARQTKVEKEETR